jgi:hypothetical protein
MSEKEYTNMWERDISPYLLSNNTGDTRKDEAMDDK